MKRESNICILVFTLTNSATISTLISALIGMNFTLVMVGGRGHTCFPGISKPNR